MSGKRIVKMTKKFLETEDPELKLANRKAPYVRVKFIDDEEEETFGSALLNDEILTLEDEPLKFKELFVGQKVVAHWKRINHYEATVVEIYRGDDQSGENRSVPIKKAVKENQKKATKAKDDLKKKNKKKADDVHVPISQQPVQKKKKEIQEENKKQKEAQAASAQNLALQLFSSNKACNRVSASSVVSQAPSSVVSQASSVSVVFQAPSVVSQASSVIVLSQAHSSVVSQAPSVSVVSQAPSVSVVSQALSVSVVSQAPSVSVMSQAHSSVVSQAPSVSVVSQAPSVSVVSQAPSVSVVSQAPSVSVMSQAHSSVVSQAPSVSVVSQAPSVSVMSQAHSSVVSQAPSVSVMSQAHYSVVSQAPSVSVVSQAHSSVVSQAPSVSGMSQAHSSVLSQAPSVSVVSQAPSSVSVMSQAPYVVSLSQSTSVVTSVVSQAPASTNWSSGMLPYRMMYSPGMMSPCIQNPAMRFPANQYFNGMQPYPYPYHNSSMQPHSYLQSMSTEFDETLTGDTSSLLDISYPTSSTPRASSNLITSSFHAIDDGDALNETAIIDPVSLGPDETISIRPLSPLSSVNLAECSTNSTTNCVDCVLKDREIHDLKQQIKALMQTDASEEPAPQKKRRYQPKTRPEVTIAHYMRVTADQALPDGYQRFAPEAPIAVKTLWLSDLLSTLSKSRSRREKKAAKRHQKVREDRNGEIVKRLMDGFYEPWDLAKEGGTSAFASDPVFQSLKLYAIHILRMDYPSFKRAWNMKMVTARSSVKRIDTVKRIDN